MAEYQSSVCHVAAQNVSKNSYKLSENINTCQELFKNSQELFENVLFIIDRRCRGEKMDYHLTMTWLLALFILIYGLEKSLKSHSWICELKELDTLIDLILTLYRPYIDLISKFDV